MASAWRRTVVAKAKEAGFFSHDTAGYHEDDIAAKEVASDETEKPGF
jgi:hypothetical protein